MMIDLVVRVDGVAPGSAGEREHAHAPAGRNTQTRGNQVESPPTANGQSHFPPLRQIHHAAHDLNMFQHIHPPPPRFVFLAANPLTDDPPPPGRPAKREAPLALDAVQREEIFSSAKHRIFFESAAC